MRERRLEKPPAIIELSQYPLLPGNQGWCASPRLTAFEDALIRFTLPAYVREQAVNSTFLAISVDSLLPKIHHVLRRIMWERGAWLPLMRRGAKIVVIAKPSTADFQPVPLWHRLERMGKKECVENYLVKHHDPAHLTRLPISMGSQARQRPRHLPCCSHNRPVRQHWVERFHGILYPGSCGNY